MTALNREQLVSEFETFYNNVIQIIDSSPFRDPVECIVIPKTCTDIYTLDTEILIQEDETYVEAFETVKSHFGVVDEKYYRNSTIIFPEVKSVGWNIYRGSDLNFQSLFDIFFDCYSIYHSLSGSDLRDCDVVLKNLWLKGITITFYRGVAYLVAGKVYGFLSNIPQSKSTAIENVYLEYSEGTDLVPLHACKFFNLGY